MITYSCKHNGIQEAISAAGEYLVNQNGVLISSNDVAVQAIIDSFDHLAYIRPLEIERVKQASAEKRLKYVTQAAGKDAEYTFKALEAKQFDIDAAVGVFMQARVTATGESPAMIAAEWNAKSLGWQSVGAAIAAIEDKSSQDIKACTDWTLCAGIADAAIAQIEAI